jgi:hypothetical protein
MRDSSRKGVQLFQLDQLVQLGARFLEGSNLPAILQVILPANLHLLEIPRDSLEGDRFFLQNIAISPKGTSFREGDKINIGARGER